MKIKRLATICIATISLMGLSGCGKSTMQNFAMTTLPQALSERANANIELAKKFHLINAISDEDYSNIVSNINDQLARYLEGVTDSEDETSTIDNTVVSESIDAVRRLHIAGIGTNPALPDELDVIVDEQIEKLVLNSDKTAYCTMGTADEHVYYMPYPDENHSFDSGETLASHVMSNYVAYKRLKADSRNDEILYRQNKNIEPIQFFTTRYDDASEKHIIEDSMAEKLNSITKSKLYVLRTDIVNNYGTNELDQLMANVQAALEGTSGDKTSADMDKAIQHLSNYFVEATDNSGNPIYLLDDKEYNMVQISRKQPDGEHKVEPGYDLRISQYNIEDVMDLVIAELNQEAYNNLAGELGLDATRIHLVKHGAEWKAYLMIYPISVINSLTLTEDKDSGGYERVEAGIKKSGLGINLKTGKFIKYGFDETTGKFDENDVTEIDAEEFYLTITPSQNETVAGTSSLVLSGYTTTTVKDNSGREHSIYCGRIILRDYLEATFAPGYNTGDDGNLAVFGRKIRMNMGAEDFEVSDSVSRTVNGVEIPQTRLLYDRGVTVGYFVDINGEKVINSPELEITDFCGAEMLQRDIKNATVFRLPYINEEVSYKYGDVTSDTPDISELTISNMADTIYPTMWFPSPDLGAVDYRTDNEKMQRFYCIATTKGIFQSALYSSWINSETPEASLAWWNGYLQDNGFTYNVSVADIQQYLTGNYRYEISQTGVVILDLETVEKIQEIFDSEDDQKRISFIRTAFIIAGWLMIGLSFVLMLLWVFDTNTDIGFGLLEKFTMGRWVAVKYEDDIPYNNANSQRYITFKGVIMKTLIFIAVGIILIRINVFAIAQLLIQTFGQIATGIEKMIRGIR